MAEDRCEAALVLQSGFRGFAARKRVRRMQQLGPDETRILGQWFDAARRGDIDLLASLCGAMPVLLDAGDDVGRTALHLAVAHNQGGAVRMLVQKGCDPQRRDATYTCWKCGTLYYHVPQHCIKCAASAVLNRAGRTPLSPPPSSASSAASTLSASSSSFPTPLSRDRVSGTHALGKRAIDYARTAKMLRNLGVFRPNSKLCTRRKTYGAVATRRGPGSGRAGGRAAARAGAGAAGRGAVVKPDVLRGGVVDISWTVDVVWNAAEEEGKTTKIRGVATQVNMATNVLLVDFGRRQTGYVELGLDSVWLVGCRDVAGTDASKAYRRIDSMLRALQTVQQKAARRIQAVQRSRVSRFQFLIKLAEHNRRMAAAQEVQRIVRGKQGRRRFADRIVEKEQERLNGAAATIQSRFRGGAARQHVAKRDAAARVIQTTYHRTRGVWAVVAARRRAAEAEPAPEPRKGTGRRAKAVSNDDSESDESDDPFAAAAESRGDMDMAPSDDEGEAACSVAQTTKAGGLVDQLLDQVGAKDSDRRQVKAAMSGIAGEEEFEYYEQEEEETAQEVAERREKDAAVPLKRLPVHGGIFKCARAAAHRKKTDPETVHCVQAAIDQEEEEARRAVHPVREIIKVKGAYLETDERAEDPGRRAREESRRHSQATGEATDEDRGEAQEAHDAARHARGQIWDS